jgi:hypothetical protein
MKQLLSLFLFLLPCLALAQYPSNGNQKITLGEQTSADGLIFRGVLADTGIITPSSDTSAYIILDTVNHRFYNYNRATNVWSVAGGGTAVTTFSGGTTGLTPSTATSGAVTLGGTLAVANGGTGGTTYGDSTLLQGRGTSAMVSSTDLLFNYTTKTLKVNGLYIGLGNSNVSSNIKIGNLATLSKTSATGSGNTAIGAYALQNNTTGKDHVAIGINALLQNTTGGYSVAIGAEALQQITTANFNCAIGRSSLQSLKTGGSNVAIGGIDTGVYADSTATTTIIGTEAGARTPFLTGGSNNTLIGYRAISSTGTVSNEITLGNSSITTIRAAVQTISSLSDRRDKTDILPLNYGMNFIEKLKPVKFVWDMRDGGKIGVNDIGFIAQDLLQSQVDLGINIPNLVSGTDEKLEASYSVLLPIIVKALQDANDKIKQLELRIINLENK